MTRRTRSSIGQQARDIALVRAIGATLGQARRAIAAQAVVVAPATLLGALAGRAWIAGLVAHGVIPAGVTFPALAAALPVAAAITIVTSLAGAMVAALRASRVRPAVALTEAGIPRRRTGAARVAVGLGLVTAGAVDLILTPAGDPGAAMGNSIAVLLAFCLGAGFLSPVLPRVAGRLARLAGGAGAVAANGIAVRARTPSGALVPLLLAAAFALVKLAQHATSAHMHGVPDPAADAWVDFTSTGVYVTFAAVAAVNTLVTVVLARRRELAVLWLAGGTEARVLAAVVCEAVMVTGTGLVVAAGVATAALVPLLHATLGTWVPCLPPGQLAVTTLAVAGLVGLGTLVPAAVVLRRRAVASVALAP